MEERNKTQETNLNRLPKCPTGIEGSCEITGGADSGIRLRSSSTSWLRQNILDLANAHQWRELSTSKHHHGEN